MGTVVTFYSYKGGVGRTFTLANIAVLLARWGHRVLCVDWDLEAPGLHEYFQPMLPGQPESGVVDLIDDFRAGRTRPAAHAIGLTGVGTLDFIAAGRNDGDYVGRLQDIDWSRLYEDGFGDYLEQCRAQWVADYDFVLLDSRTGVSDIASICTAHLPDRLVAVFTANLQSIRGVVDIAGRANAARDRLALDRPQLTVLPVLSRFDSREEYARSEEWRRISLRETKDLFHNWLDRMVSVDLITRHLTLPYVSYWSFGEQLPVRSESKPGADQISFALETVAAVIAHEFGRTDLLVENRDAYVASVHAVNREFGQDVRVSTPRSTLEFAKKLVKELSELKVTAELSMSGDRSLLARTTDNARHLCLLVDGQVSPWQAREVELFLRLTVGQDRRVIPVLNTDTGPNALPGYLSNLRYLRFDPALGTAKTARELTNELNGTDPRDADQSNRDYAWELVAEILKSLHAAIASGDPPPRSIVTKLDDLMTRHKETE